MTDLDLTGYWWDSSNPDKKQPGTLRIDQNGQCELFLIQGFDIPVDEVSGQWENLHIDVIHGVAGDEEISLIDCYDLNTKLDMLSMRIGTQTIRARKALVGFHLGDVTVNVFRSCQVQIDNLHHWVRLGRPSSTLEAGDNEVRLTFKDEKSTPFHADGFSFTLETTSNLKVRRNTRRFPTVDGITTTTLFIESDELRSDRGFDDLLSAVVDLLSFARDEPCSMIRQVLTHDTPHTSMMPRFDEAGQLIPDGVGGIEVEEHQTPRTGVVYTPHVYSTGSESRPQSESKKFLFTVNDIPFDELFPRWLDLRKKVRSSTDMLFSLLYARPRYVEVRMLVVAAAAEALSRSLYKDVQPMLPFDFDRLRKISLDAIAPSDHERFLSVFRNEPNYRDRVLHLACLPNPQAVEVVIPDREQWANDLRDARHGLAHGLPGRSGPDNLPLLYARTVYLMYLVLMHELGFSEVAQLRAAETNQYLVNNRNP